MNESSNFDEPLFYIGVTSRMVSLHPQTLRHYEDLGLVVPQRSDGNTRLYSMRDVERLQKISRLTNELGVNLAGVEVILNLLERVDFLQRELDQMQAEMQGRITELRTQPSQSD